MVFGRAMDSFLPPCADGQTSSDALKKSGTNLSLKDLIAPLRKQSSIAVDDLLKHAYGNTDLSERSTASNTSATASPIIVETQHHQLRTIRRGAATDVPRTDCFHQQALRLPRFDGNFCVPEHSDGLDGSKGTALMAYDEFEDSASDSRSTPLMEALLFSRDQEESSSPKVRKPAKPNTSVPQTPHTSSSSSTATAALSTFTMSSPRTPTSPSSNTQARRSRSIAIKSPQPTSGYYPGTSASQVELAAAEEDSVSNERMYDWATWRMYNRIVDHRRSQRLSSSSQQLDANRSFTADPSVYSYGGAMNVPLNGLAAADYVHDGEVFELEI